MRKLRYLNLGICLTIICGLIAPNALVFAETELENASETVEETEEDGEENEEEVLTLPGNVLIKSFNPGYSNEGEFFELMKLPDVKI